ncbi:MAG: hypothetical protein PF481_00475 [Bacteroidales bacterium]|nr:hypothetical protein [Bacteroidales bacterium]
MANEKKYHGNLTIETILKVFKALQAKVNFNVELIDGDYTIV